MKSYLISQYHFLILDLAEINKKIKMGKSTNLNDKDIKSYIDALIWAKHIKERNS